MQTITITFKDGTVLDALTFSQGQRHFQKADRQMATFTFNIYQIESFTQLKNIFKSEFFTGEIEVHTVVKDDETGEITSDTKVLLEDFVILSKLIFDEKTYKLIPDEDQEQNEEVSLPNPAWVPVYTAELAQLSILEKNQRVQTAMVEENMDAIIELAGLIG